MVKRVKTKVITTVVCLALSLPALDIVLFLLDVSLGWRIFLILLGISWIATGIMNLRTYLGK